MIHLSHIEKPTLLVDESKCRANIQQMVQKAQQAGVVLRPHFKTHQSASVGTWFREAGVEAITVSSVEMGVYFAQHGWQDISIAFPVNLREAAAIATLAKQVKLQLLVESEFVVHELAGFLLETVTLNIKIDTGAKRSGIEATDIDKIAKILAVIETYPQFLTGSLLVHAGHTYQAKGQADIASITQSGYDQLNHIKSRLGKPGLKLSWGDTPSCSLAQPLPPFDEWRPGNFVFYDLMQYHIGSCRLDQIAVAVACPVVAIHPKRKQAVIYGGAVHFSKEHIEADNGFKLYGYVVELNNTTWQDPAPAAWLGSLSQEHGIVNLPDAMLDRIRPGILLGILPVHSCLTVSCLKAMQTLSGERLHCM